MKRFLLSAMLVAFTFCECGSAAAKQLPSPPPEPHKHTAKSNTPVKKHQKAITGQQAERLRKKSEKEGKRHEMAARKREYRQMEESRERGMMQMQEEIQKQQKTKGPL